MPSCTSLTHCTNGPLSSPSATPPSSIPLTLATFRSLSTQLCSVSLPSNAACMRANSARRSASDAIKTGGTSPVDEGACTAEGSEGNAEAGRDARREGVCGAVPGPAAAPALVLAVLALPCDAACERVNRRGGASAAATDDEPMDRAGALPAREDESVPPPALDKLAWLGLRSSAPARAPPPPSTAPRTWSCTFFATSSFAMAFLRSAFAAGVTDGWQKTAMVVWRASERTEASGSERSGRSSGVKGRRGGRGVVLSGAGHRTAVRKCSACGGESVEGQPFVDAERLGLFAAHLFPRPRVLARKAVLVHALFDQGPRPAVLGL